MQNLSTGTMSHRILLVDDEIDILEFVRYNLQKEGYEVFTAQNGAEALKAADILAGEGVSARVINMHTVKPLDEALVLKAAEETGAIVTSEEHNIIGGLGEAVSGYLSGVRPTPVVRHGVEDQFGRSGKAAEVLAAYGLTAEGMADKARAAIALKKR